mmetsp:Transcript_4786/g.10974  ORF Transcript_4786/g.10974 Transcript_4786/m.10974 type:complete len:126 (+) Transcript_4786:55-432(+)
MALSVTEFLDSSGGLLISLLVLLAVEVASRSGQVHLAAAAAAIPTGLPLALLIVASKSKNAEVLVDFSDAVLRGTCSTLIFALAMAFAARKHWTVPQMLLISYAAWFAAWIALKAAVDVAQRKEE